MKRLFFGFFACIFLFGYGLLAADRAACADIELKFAHFMSPMHIQHQKSFEPFAKRVQELTGGKVAVKIYPGGALGAPNQLPDAVKTGITDIAFIIPSYSTGRFERISALDLPFFFNSAVHATKTIYDMADQYFAEDFKDYKVLWFYSCGPGQFQSVSKPMHTLDDFKGMKMRAPSAYMSKAFKLLGSTPVGMPISELTVSLEKGVIDGMLTPFSAVKDFRLFDLVKHITEADVYVSPMAVVMNKGKFASLPDYAKQALEKASGKEWGIHAAQVYDDHDLDTAKEIRALGKTTIFKMPDAERKNCIARLRSMENDWAAEISKKGIPAQEILDAAHKFADKNR